MRRLSGLDATFLALETPSMHMHVSAVMIFEPLGDAGDQEPSAVQFERTRHLVSERLPLVPLLRRRAMRVPFGLNHPVWVEDPAFDLDFHLRRASLPEPGGPRELAQYVAEAVGRPLDPSRPLWEMHVVEALESGHVAVVPKLHHAMIDGVSGAEVMAAFLDGAPSEPPSPGTTTAGEGAWEGGAGVRPGPVPSDPELVLGAFSSLVRHPDRALDALRTTFGAVRRLTERNRRLREEDELQPPPGPFHAPRTSLNGALSAHRRYAFAQAPLDDLRIVKRAFGGTVNDVLLAAVGGALRRLLAERGEELDDPLVALAPISARAGVGQALESLGAGERANSITAMLVSLATSVADPVERLRAVAEGTRLAKEQAAVLTDDLISGWAQLAFPALSTRLARLAGNLRLFDHLPPACNVIVSNIAGPATPLWLAGSRLVAAYPVGPVIEGVGLNITAMSYTGTLYVGLLGCRELVPEVEHLADLLTDSLVELVKAALHHGGHWA